MKSFWKLGYLAKNQIQATIRGTNKTWKVTGVDYDPHRYLLHIKFNTALSKEEVDKIKRNIKT